MKKNLFLLAAVAAALVSCNQDVLIDEPVVGPETPIAFSTFADKATRADKPASSDFFLEDYHQTMSVYGTKKDGDDNVQLVFSNVTCTFDAAETDITGEWAYSPARYWDKQAKNYKFVGFAPATAPMEYVIATDSEVDATGNKFQSTSALTLVGTNLQEGDPQNDYINVGFYGTTGVDCDVMITKSVNTVDGFVASMPDVDLIYGHTLAKLVVTFTTPLAATDGTVTINNVKVSNYLSEGSFDTNAWTADATSTKIDYEYTTPAKDLTTNTTTYFIESLVFPQALTDDQKLSFNYTITSADNSYTEDFPYSIKISDVFTSESAYAGDTVYLINFTIDPESNVIKFDAGVSDWSDLVQSDKTI